jgi:hypothetical protein
MVVCFYLPPRLLVVMLFKLPHHIMVLTPPFLDEVRQL